LWSSDLNFFHNQCDTRIAMFATDEKIFQNGKPVLGVERNLGKYEEVKVISTLRGLL
jgi:hypothetical protein